VGEKYASFFKYIEGEHIKVNQASEEKIIHIAKQHARMNSLLYKIKINSGEIFCNPFDLTISEKDFGLCSEFSFIDTEFLKMTLDQFNKLPKKKLIPKLKRGIVHYDLNINNILINDKDITFLDFDLICYGVYSYDLAASLAYFIHSKERVEKNIIRAYIKSYTEENKLNTTEKDLLYDFLIRHHLGVMFFMMKERSTENNSKAWVRFHYQGLKNLTKIGKSGFIRFLR